MLNEPFTPIPNFTMEALAKIKLNGSEFRAMFIIFRKTFGYKSGNGRKLYDRIAYSQLSEGTGISSKVMNRILKGLEEKNVIIKHEGWIYLHKSILPPSYLFNNSIKSGGNSPSNMMDTKENREIKENQNRKNLMEEGLGKFLLEKEALKNKMSI